MELIVITISIFLLLDVKFVLATGSLQSDTFQSVSCSNPLYEMVIKATSVKETSQKSKLWCAVSCGRNVQCNFAVFRESETWCKHVYNYTTDSPVALPGYTNDTGCYVLMKNEQPLCQNGGSYLGTGGACVCKSTLYYGLLCEVFGFNFCLVSGWRHPTFAETYTYMYRKAEMKISIHQPSAVRIFNLLYIFLRNGDAYEFGSMEYLAMTSNGTETFEEPLKREFIFCSERYKELMTYRVDMTSGDNIDTSYNPDCQLWIRDIQDPNPVLWYHYYTADPSPLITGILQGYRQMSRDVLRVGVSETEGKIYHGERKISTMEGSIAFPSSMYFVKVSLDVKRIFTQMVDMHANFIKSDIHQGGVNYELDRCWAKFPANLTHNELRETVLGGQEVRIIMGSTIVSDITVVTVTPTDAIAFLAPYYTPFDSDSSFPSDSRIRFSLITHSKTESFCEMKNLDSQVFLTNSSVYYGTLEWVVSTRVWTKRFQTDFGRQTLFGTSQSVYDAAVAMSGIRACVQKSDNMIFTCYSSRTLTATADGHVLLQTHAVLGSKLTPDWIYDGLLDSDCRRYVWLLSTKGRVERAAYVLGQSDPPDAVVTEHFLTLTWFSQA